ncbi:MAG TPA: oxidoreductase [Candidatus Bathyarchaeota archaeon]|nr:oxidoreductase [Candidatus Bathyarchaeota archaeon]
MDKPKIGVFKFTGCAGCQMAIIHLEERLLDIFGGVEIRYFKMATSRNPGGPYDISLIEGSVSTPEEIKEIKEIRKNSRYLVALGTCAVYGGVQAMRNPFKEIDVEKKVYEKPEYIMSLESKGIDEYVDVDGYIYGCPINVEEAVFLIKSLLLGFQPYYPEYSVCVECKMKGNECLLLKRGEKCIGPITRGGCDAICTTNKFPCQGCRGPLYGTNIDGLFQKLSKMGIDREEVINIMRKYVNEVYLRGEVAR